MRSTAGCTGSILLRKAERAGHGLEARATQEMSVGEGFFEQSHLVGRELGLDVAQDAVEGLDHAFGGADSGVERAGAGELFEDVDAVELGEPCDNEVTA